MKFILPTSTLLASENEFRIGQSIVTLTLNPGGTTAITFRADKVALEPNETFVLELTLLGVSNGVIDTSLPNVFFPRRQMFIIQDSTSKCDYVIKCISMTKVTCSIFGFLIVIRFVCVSKAPFTRRLIRVTNPDSQSSI